MYVVSTGTPAMVVSVSQVQEWRIMVNQPDHFGIKLTTQAQDQNVKRAKIREYFLNGWYNTDFLVSGIDGVTSCAG